MMPVSNGESIVTARQGGRKVRREFISGFFAVHISSTEDGWLSA
jgi:hypothetical protein